MKHSVPFLFTLSRLVPFAVAVPEKPDNRLVDDLADIVSKNGCLLLNVAPAPDGFRPQDQQDILRAMSRWLQLNGEAIYGSHP